MDIPVDIPVDIIVSPARKPGAGLLGFAAPGRARRRFSCALGRGGVRADKREGDGATPAGRFPLRRVLYRADRLARPETALDVRPLGPADGWCDDPADGCYNRQVRLPHRTSAEALWREDGRYDVIVVLGYNDDPVVPGKGSAIFLHVAEPIGAEPGGAKPIGTEPFGAGPAFAATKGCVALALADLLELLAAAGPGSRLSVSPEAG